MDEGQAYFEKGEYAKAEACARSSIGECRKNGNASGELQSLFLLGKVLCHLDRHGEALGVYTKLARPLVTSLKSKEYEEYLWGVVECKHELDQLDDAFNLATRRCELTSELFGDKAASAKKQLADILFSKKDYKGALASYESAREFSDDRLLVDMCIADTLVKLDKHDQALTIRQRNAESAKNDDYGWYAIAVHDLASSYASYELYDLSVECEAKALEIRLSHLGPDDSDTVESVKKLETYRLKNAKSCVVCKKSAKKPCSRCEEFWYCSSECQLSHWNTEHKGVCLTRKLALEAVQQFLDKKYYVHAEARATRATRMYHALKDHKSEWNAYVHLTNAMHYRGKTEEQIRLYETVVRPLTIKVYTEQSEQYFGCMFSVVNCLVKLKRFEEARVLLDNQQTLVVELYGEKSTQYYQVIWQCCNVFYYQGNYEEALPYFEKMVPKSTEYPPFLKMFITVLSRTGDYARTLKAMLNFDRENADVSFGLALLYGMLGRFDCAAFYAEKTLSIKQDDRYAKCVTECRKALTDKALSMQLAPKKRMCIHCDTIFDIFNVAYLCGTCQKAPYCSTACQLADWPEHEKICKPRCGHCWKENVKLGWCGGCEELHYCSTECQLADWNFDHKNVCCKRVSSE